MPVLANAGERAINTLPDWQVIVIGLGVVFVGLICIVALCSLMSAIIRLVTPKKPAPAPAAEAPAASAGEIPDRQRFVAAVSAVIAEEMGTDVTRLRIKSIKKI
ncbi:MAG: OadG family protein [Acutalibacteraceae bacterium]|jgi:sodium pump decarboxylase gamma subunit